MPKRLVCRNLPHVSVRAALRFGVVVEQFLHRVRLVIRARAVGCTVNSAATAANCSNAAARLSTISSAITSGAGRFAAFLDALVPQVGPPRRGRIPAGPHALRTSSARQRFRIWVFSSKTAEFN
jgi:hypothetical protein